jgi:hypothetical protein
MQCASRTEVSEATISLQQKGELYNEVSCVRSAHVSVKTWTVEENSQLQIASRRAASLQEGKTSTDRPDTRHQGVRIDCNGMIVIPTSKVGNKGL